MSAFKSHTLEFQLGNNTRNYKGVLVCLLNNHGSREPTQTMESLPLYSYGYFNYKGT